MAGDVQVVKPGALEGGVEAPPSKSVFQRALAAAALARGTSRILAPSLCADAEASLRAARALGARVEILPGQVRVTGGALPSLETVDCGESGLTLRLFAPLAALGEGRVVLSGRGSLFRRPVGMLPPALEALGAACGTREGFPPLWVRGPLRGGEAAVDGSLTSQAVSGLLMALPLCEADSLLRVVGLRSKGYVRTTLRIMEEFGVEVEGDPDSGEFYLLGGRSYSPREYRVEGDWSGGAFLLAAGALAGRVTVKGLDPESSQPDKRILEALEAAGAKVSVGEGGVSVERRELQGFDFDATDCPDLFPVLAVLAAFCRGRTVLAGADRLRHKESDRAVVLVGELSRLGARIRREGDTLVVEGGGLRGGGVRSHGDHRIAMALALAGLGAKAPVCVTGASCVAKSYPDFFHHLSALVGGGP